MSNVLSIKASRNPMELTVKIKNVYGNETIYPICEKGELLASFKGQKTFTRKDIEALKQLGYVFTVQQIGL